MATDAQLRNITFWSLGSLGGTTWTAVSAVAPCMLTGLFFLSWLARPLNVFLLGEAEAGHLGIQVERLKRGVVVLVALAVGAAVSTAGIIGFVGLVVPHVVRLLLGPTTAMCYQAPPSSAPVSSWALISSLALSSPQRNCRRSYLHGTPGFESFQLLRGESQNGGRALRVPCDVGVSS